MRPAASDNQRCWLVRQSGQAVANHLGRQGCYRCDLIGCWPGWQNQVHSDSDEKLPYRAIVGRLAERRGH